MRALFQHTLNAKGWLRAWAIYLIAFPFYFLPAGNAQPSDIYIALIMGIYLSLEGFKMHKDSKKVVNHFVRFIAYLTIVNVGVALVLLGYDNQGLPWFVYSAFYIYNAMVMAFAFSLYSKYGRAFLYTTLYSCIFAALLQIGLASIFETGGEGVRGAMFFTNPNQLGYYSICGLAIVVVLESMLKIPKYVIYSSFLLFGYLAIVSVSKAALGALIILLGVYLIANGIFSLRNALAVLIVGGISFFALQNTAIGDKFSTSLELRAKNDEDRPDEITEWEYRGYDRISNHPYYLVLGAGEGGYNRFDTFIENHEIHSSVGTIVFCYGIPGTVLFIIFILSLFKKLPWYYLIYSLPVFSYGVTHMGLRFTIFWVALMMFPLIRMEIAKKNFIIKKRRLQAIQNYNRSAVSEVSA